MTRRRLAVVLVGLMLGACAGDTSHKVDYVNTTADPLYVYEAAGSRHGSPDLVAAGDTFHDRWLVTYKQGLPFGGPRQIEATTLNGERIFCHVYSYEELEKLEWIIRVEPRNDCGNE